MRAKVLAPFLIFLLSGCALVCRECRYLPYSEDYNPPQVLPAPGSYSDAEQTWTREDAFGINGSMKVTFESPAYQAAALAWSAEESRLGTDEREALLRSRWQERYDGGKRVAFKVALSMDSRFYSRKQLDLADWHFVLTDETGKALAPSEVGRPQISEDGDTLKGDFYLYFARFDAQGHLQFENPRYLRLDVVSPLTKLDFTWRFRPMTQFPNG